MTARDSGAFIAALEAEGVRGPIGAVGYCMGGGRALNAAAAHPDKIAAAASFHGGRLGTDAPDSPASNASKIKARVYVGSAGVDGSFPPEQSARLAQACGKRKSTTSSRIMSACSTAGACPTTASTTSSAPNAIGSADRLLRRDVALIDRRSRHF
jgi:dienelactone hydrolase